MKQALIISGGDFDPSTLKKEYDYIIACDKGYNYALHLNLIPDVVIGDFDSSSLSFIEKSVENTKTQILSFPIRKDDTDTMLAIKHALDLGYQNIHIICGLGLRMDHTISNIQSMHYVASHGGMCEMDSSREYFRTITPEDGLVPIEKKDNFSLSLFALSDKVSQVSINGTSYDCVTDLTNSFPLGHGNHFVSDTASISIKEGVLLVVLSHE